MTAVGRDIHRQLDREFARWTAGMHSLTDADLARPCGPVEGPYAELALLRDLYAHTR